MDRTRYYQQQQEAKRLQNRISSFLEDFRVGTLLSGSNIRKLRGAKPLAVFTAIFTLPFVGVLKPVRTALNTVTRHREAILARWDSGHRNARIEALNGIFQAAKCRARGYRNDDTFISIIYLLAAPIQQLLKST